MTEGFENSAREHWRLMEASFQRLEDCARIMRQTADAIGASNAYRIYLLDKDGKIDAAESFPATHDDAAVDIGGLVYDASNDVFANFEVWEGTRCVRPFRGPRLRTTEKTAEKYQDVTVDLEIRLQDAFACVARSRKLLEVSARLLDRILGSRRNASGAGGTHAEPAAALAVFLDPPKQTQ